jgi:hypothetical protein
MARYKNVAGIAREISKRYINVDGIAREVSKGYTNINGVAREYYSNGVIWKKYVCLYEIGNYTLHTRDTPYSISRSSGYFCPSYTFSESYGFKEDGDVIYRRADGVGVYGDPADAIGMYDIDMSTDWYDRIREQRVYSVTDIQNSGSGAYFRMEYTVYAEAPIYGYEQGSSHYGEIIAEEGAMPEEGHLIEGSPQDSYCIIVPRGDSEPYYYVKQQ